MELALAMNIYFKRVLISIKYMYCGMDIFFYLYWINIC